MRGELRSRGNCPKPITFGQTRLRVFSLTKDELCRRADKAVEGYDAGACGDDSNIHLSSSLCHHRSRITWTAIWEDTDETEEQNLVGCSIAFFRLIQLHERHDASVSSVNTRRL